MEPLLAHCQAAFAQHGHLLATMFAAGLVGGFTHCMGMCGPFVLAQSLHQDAFKGRPAYRLTRLAGAALLPYHAGRATSYAGLGAVAAVLSRQIVGTGWHQGAMATLLAIAGLLFLLHCLPGGVAVPQPLRWTRRLGDALGRAARPFFAAPDSWRGYVLGMMLGFMPCGLIFAALMMAATTGSPLGGALGMALFALGTVPALLLVGTGGRLAYRWKPQLARQVGRGIMAANGVFLLIAAGHSLI